MTAGIFGSRPARTTWPRSSSPAAAPDGPRAARSPTVRSARTGPGSPGRVVPRSGGVRHGLRAIPAVRHAGQHGRAGVPGAMPAGRRDRRDPRRRWAAAVPVRDRALPDHRLHHHGAPALPDARRAPPAAGRRRQPACAHGVRLADQPTPAGGGGGAARPGGLPGVRADRGREHRDAHAHRHRRRPGPRAGPVGRPHPQVEVSVRDEAEREVHAGAAPARSTCTRRTR